MIDLVIRGGSVVTPDGVGLWDVAIEGEHIAAVAVFLASDCQLAIRVRWTSRSRLCRSWSAMRLKASTARPTSSAAGAPGRRPVSTRRDQSPSAKSVRPAVSCPMGWLMRWAM